VATKEGEAMANAISGVAGIAALRLETEFQAKVAKLQKDATEFQGDMAVQLIQSVTGVGGNLDVQV